MRAARLALLIAVLAASPLVASAGAASGAPRDLRGFLLRPNEPVTHTFSRTPAFAWSPVRGALCYEFQLATSRTFQSSTLVWSNVATDRGAGKRCRTITAKKQTIDKEAGGDVDPGEATTVSTIPPIRIPAVSLGVTLPWFTGRPYALYAHVRAVTTSGATAWSRPFAFNMRWESTPVPMPSRAGLVRWTPVEGATSYQVWFPDIGRSFSTHTNVADQRELYTFHLEDQWWATVRWRVRAVREVLGSSWNGLPVVSYGPWSPVYASANPAWSSGKIQLRTAISDVVTSSWQDAAHQLMPALTFTGDTGLDGKQYRLFRFYAFTDRDCVNVVFKGSVVGGPAFAPRTSGPLALPTSLDDLDYLTTLGVAGYGKSETAKTLMADGTPVVASETVGEEDVVRVDLPDVDAKTTRYFWTVVPVGAYVTDEGTLEYHDVEIPQDACEAGRVATFAKVSRPVVTASGGAYVAGLSPRGRLLASAGNRPVVYSTPLVAWRPVIGADAYEVEWSRSAYPWRPSGSSFTRSTATVLKLAPGRWYYRVRGMNSRQIGLSGMTWSRPVAVRVLRPTFRIASR
ncbi:MAG TPA: hypothetical protein VNJ53_14075 [Gaiellaceae bacterium]|nr:hypothetical protein [Gaiellaceae bacterium]